jgi:hypothetical protein
MREMERHENDSLSRIGFPSKGRTTAIVLLAISILTFAMAGFILSRSGSHNHLGPTIPRKSNR